MVDARLARRIARQRHHSAAGASTARCCPSAAFRSDKLMGADLVDKKAMTPGMLELLEARRQGAS